MQRFGLVGHPNAGKSSLFNVLTGAKVLAAPYPFATVDANVGVAAIPDKRLDTLVNMSQSSSIVPASVHFTDIGGLVEGASEGEGLGNQFLASIREADAIVYVLRAFESKDLPSPPSALSQLEILEVELSLADLDSAERQLDKRQRKTKAEKPGHSEPSTAAELEALSKAVDLLQRGIPIYRGGLGAELTDALESNSLLTNKPVLAVLNVDEMGLASDKSKNTQKEISQAIGGGEVISICVELETVAMELTADERRELLPPALSENAEAFKEPITRFVRSAYELLGLRTFFTTGPKETRAWTFPVGAAAPECAGLIHTDMERGFIRADCIQASELLEHGSMQAAKEVGKVMGVGRDYLVQDGDVLEIRFNV